MTSFTNEQIHRGVGAFDHAMRSQDGIAGNVDRMPLGVAIGIIAAAIRSGLPAAKIDAMIDGDFARSAPFLRRVLTMYEGDDWSVNLWNLLPSGQYKPCTDLCVLAKPAWRYDRNGTASLD